MNTYLENVQLATNWGNCSSQLEISHVLNGTNPEIQHRQ